MVVWPCCGRVCRCFIFLIVLLLPLGLVDMTETPFWYCTGSSNYTANSTFGHNLQEALNSVLNNVSLSSFSNATVGKSSNQAFAAAQCRGDLDGEACQVCVSDAASQAVQRCPTNRVVFVFFQACIMYYRDANFTVPRSFMNLSLPRPEVVPDPQRFETMLTFFFNKLIVSATTNPSGRLFWGDMFTYTQNFTIYATAQCVHYLSPKGCRSCLDIAFAQMLKDFGDKQGGVVYHNLECLVRFEPFPYFTPTHKIAPSSAISISSNCSLPTSDNKSGSPFHKNLKALLSYLIENTPSSGIYNDTVGLGSSQVYGQGLCRGDIPDYVCWRCTAQASSKIQELCPNSRRAIIWLEHCQLRYSDENFGGMVDVYDRACQAAAENAPNPTSFHQNLRILISNLTLVAIQNSSNRFFAIGMLAIPDSKRIYALVQCVRDIPVDQCRWCLQNASSAIEGCSNGKQGGRILRGSCSIAFGVDLFFHGDPILVSLPQTSHGHKHWWIFVIICFVGGLLLALSCVLCLARRRQQDPENQKQKEEISTDFGSIKENEASYDLTHISLRAIEDATDNFTGSNKLGEGGYGPVYKGNLPNGQEVAVKRLSGCSKQGLKEFRNEVELIAKLQHTNLVRLIGCCLENEENMLVYEYMPNKSLDFFLKDPEKRMLLDWEKRFNIIMGIARGILYLHQDSRLNIIHRDLKASNVLLDEQLNPKISDFGLARIFSGVLGQESTSIIVGTYGYMAPEYAMDGVFSTKSDVFSFGILLLEIISGQLNSSFCAAHQGRCLIEHAWSFWCREKGMDFIDPVLKDAIASTRDQMLRCLHIGLLCIEEDAATRPTMSVVLLMLGNNASVLSSPTRPPFIGEDDAESSLPFSSVVWPVAPKSTR